MNEANFEYVIVDDFIDNIVVIRDLGPWDQFMTVTNDAKNVVREILMRYPNTKRIFYYDSEDQKDELLIKDGKFCGFAPIPIEK